MTKAPKPRRATPARIAAALAACEGIPTQKLTHCLLADVIDEALVASDESANLAQRRAAITFLRVLVEPHSARMVPTALGLHQIRGGYREPSREGEPARKRRA